VNKRRNTENLHAAQISWSSRPTHSNVPKVNSCVIAVDEGDYACEKTVARCAFTTGHSLRYRIHDKVSIFRALHLTGDFVGEGNGKDQHRAVGGFDGGALLGVELIYEVLQSGGPEGMCPLPVYRCLQFAALVRGEQELPQKVFGYGSSDEPHILAYNKMKSRLMNGFGAWFLISATAVVLAQQSGPDSVRQTGIILLGVSRNDSTFKGGISGSKQTGKGTVVVEPIARVTASGDWKEFPCDSRDGKSTRACIRFAREYLSHPHAYTVVSADGKGGEIHTQPVALSGCYSYDGVGTYSGSTIAGSAIAAESTDFFAGAAPPRSLGSDESAPIRKALAALVPKRLDSLSGLRLFSLDMQGQRLVVVQRAFSDRSSGQRNERFGLIFAIGTMDHDRFKVLHWKRNAEDEDERILGTIRLKSGEEFLITAVSEPESQSFRVYGIRDEQLKLIYSGGGSSC